jgi:hypothetical protein
MRATIIVTVDEPDSVGAGEAWFARWRPHLAYCSENTGCGCCVDIWDVDAPEEAVEELPWELRAMSEWTHPDIPAAEPVQRVWLRRTVRRKWKKSPSSRD